MRVEERLLKYVSYWTTSDEECRQIPSSERQFELGKVLEQELRDLGLEKVTLTDHCYVYGLLPATKGYADKPAVGFISHMDTAPDFSGKDVKPQIIPDYDGNDVLLKGSGVAALYPVPEYRKSGDIDILMKNKEEAERACKILEKRGFCKKEYQAAHHHIACSGVDGIEMELHVTLAEPFDSEKTNTYLKQCQASFFEHRKSQDVMGVTFELAADAYQAFYLLLHMLQHFLRAGFGLKLLCDWVVFWEKPVRKEEKDTFIQLLEGSGLIGFASIITAVCVKYLQLDREKVAFLLDRESFDKKTVSSFMKEIFEAEEFGHSDTDRMVVLRGTKLTDYIREFHHQMKLTYPKAGRCVILYPVLWIMTLCGFLYRNRKVRGTSGRAIMKKAHKRSKLMEQIHLFR